MRANLEAIYDNRTSSPPLLVCDEEKKNILKTFDTRANVFILQGFRRKVVSPLQEASVVARPTVDPHLRRLRVQSQVARVVVAP